MKSKQRFNKGDLVARGSEVGHVLKKNPSPRGIIYTVSLFRGGHFEAMSRELLLLREGGVPEHEDCCGITANSQAQKIAS